MEELSHPVSGIDYPGTFQDFDKWFSSENACLDYIAKIRWLRGFICPSCGVNTDKLSLIGRALLFYRLMQQAIYCRPVPRKMIISGQTQHMADG